VLNVYTAVLGISLLAEDRISFSEEMATYLFARLNATMTRPRIVASEMFAPAVHARSRDVYL
jgi:hypothetical protein